MNSDYHIRMIKSLLRPNRITDRRLCHALEEVNREDFYPDATKQELYSDCTLALNTRRQSPSFLSIARLLNFAAIDQSHHILVVGAGTGYCAVVCSYLAAKVTALESDQELYEKLTKYVDAGDIPGVSTILSPLQDGYPDHAPYDRILICGAIDVLPEKLFQQLSDFGTLLCFENHGMTLCRIIEYKNFKGALRKEPLHEAPAPALVEFDVPQTFRF